MFDAHRTLLPATAPALAKALDIVEERLFDLPISMITKDPMTVSEALLDHLAWEHSVDVWDIDWPEDIKRAVVQMATEIHRFKGSPYAIRRALEAFDVRTELVEWWQGGPDRVPGTFTVTAYAGRSLYNDDEVFINRRMVRAIIAVIERVSPVSRGFSVIVGAKLKPPKLRMATHSSALSASFIRMRVVQQRPMMSSQVAVGTNATALSATRHRLTG